MYFSGSEFSGFCLLVEMAEQLSGGGGIVRCPKEHKIATPIVNLDVQALFNLL